MKRIRIWFAIAGAVIAAAQMLAAPVMAEASPKANGAIHLRYYDSADGSDPVSGASFSCIKVAELVLDPKDQAMKTRFASLVKDENGETVEITMDTDMDVLVRAVDAKYGNQVFDQKIIETDEKGEAHALGLSDGVYLVREMKPAAEHLASAPFLCCIPYTRTGKDVGLSYEITAEPKPEPCGRLLISKRLNGNAAETDRVFHFQVRFSNDGNFRLTKPDGTQEPWTKEKEIELRGGETASISMIPVGTEYEVREKEANADGYETTSSGEKGTIRRKLESKAVFLNKKYQDTTTKRGNVKTGDAAKIGMLVLMLAGSMATMIGLIFGRKERTR